MSIFKQKKRLWILYQVCPQGPEKTPQISKKGHYYIIITLKASKKEDFNPNHIDPLPLFNAPAQLILDSSIFNLFFH